MLILGSEGTVTFSMEYVLIQFEGLIYKLDHFGSKYGIVL